MFKDKYTLITGGASGLGEAISLLLAAKKSNLIITYNTNKEKAETLKTKLITEYKINVIIIKCDIANEEEIKNLIDSLKKEQIIISYLVNNAGICLDSLYEDKNKTNFMKTLEVNLVGTFLMSKYIGDMMYQNKFGSIINISSTNGINKYYPMSLDYDASKAAINSLTHNLALEYSPYIRVNAIAPGWIKTENEMKDLDSEYIQSEEEKIFIKRFAEPVEIARVVAFLLSDEASYINNQIISVDGGMY